MCNRFLFKYLWSILNLTKAKSEIDKFKIDIVTFRQVYNYTAISVVIDFRMKKTIFIILAFTSAYCSIHLLSFHKHTSHVLHMQTLHFNKEVNCEILVYAYIFHFEPLLVLEL